MVNPKRVYTHHSKEERVTRLRARFLALENKKLRIIAEMNRLRIRAEHIADKQQAIHLKIEKMRAPHDLV